jgi:uncharacterized protein with PQ loop repeat
MSKFALLFLFIFIGGIGATFVVSGASSFILYQLIYFLNPDDRWWSAEIPGISYSFIAAVLMLGALAVRYRECSNLAPWTEIPAFKWMIALLGMYYLAYLYALNAPLHDRFTYDFTKLIVIVLVAYKLVNSPKSLDVSLWAYIVGATYIGYLATITGRNSQGRVEGIGMVDAPDANDMAAALVPAAALLMYFAWMGSKKVKILCGICGAFIANGLVLINSRGAFLGVAFGAGFYLLHMIFSRHRQKGQRGMAIVIITLGLSGGLYVTDDLFWERMSTLQNVEDQDASGSGRVNYWMATFDMMEDFPMGMGVYGYNTVSSLYLSEEQRGQSDNKSVHSLWFQGLSEVGWIGIFIFGGLLVSLYRLSKKAKIWLLEQTETVSYFKLLALECALLSYLVSGSFINRFRAEILYWMILLLAIAINVYFLQRVRKTKDSKGPRIVPPQFSPSKEQQA